MQELTSGSDKKVGTGAEPARWTGRVPRELWCILEPLAQLVAEFVLAQLPSSVDCGARYYTATTSPIPRKAFLAAAREGRFSSYRVKKRVYALREEVHRYIESERRVVAGPVAKDKDDGLDDEIGELLDRANLRPTRRRR